jgi:hypothetical protein
VIAIMLCKVLGHKRGKRAGDMPLEAGRIWYRCPRCGATWLRKAKPTKLKAAA